MSTVNQSREERVRGGPEEEFIQTLIDAMNTDRAAIAAFKRALGCSIAESGKAMQYFYPLLPQSVIGQPFKEEVYFLVATLFSYIKEAGTMRLPNAAKLFKSQDSGSGISQRFKILLDSKFEKDEMGNLVPGELGKRLKAVLGILKSKGLKIDWVDLLFDLLRWNHPSKFIQKEWARIFFSKGQLEASNSQNPTI